MSDPFAPINPQSGAPSGPTVPCTSCGVPVDPNAAGYSERGGLICKQCEAKETIHTGEQRAATGIVSGAAGAFGAAMLSMCINPFLLVSFVAVGGGIGTLVTLSRHPEYKAKLGARYGFVMAAAILAILIGLAGPCLRILALAGIAALGGPR